MDEQRRRHETDVDVGRASDDVPTGRLSRWKVVTWVVIALGILALIVFLHMSGAIGPGSHQGV
jgi:hypothetical protein